MGNIVLGGNGNNTYQIDTSLLVDNESSQLQIDYGASVGDTKTWTFSTWLRPHDSGDTRYLFYSLSDAGATTYATLYVSTNQTLYFFQRNAGVTTALFNSNEKLRDYNHWYHVVLVYDTTEATATDRVKIYIDGIRATDDGDYVAPVLNDTTCCMNEDQLTVIGSGYGANAPLGYLAETIFIDGVACSPTDFGEWHPVSTKVWRPRHPQAAVSSGGSNSFWLQYTSAGVGVDSSDNGNDFTATLLTVGSNVKSDTPTNAFCTVQKDIANAIYVYANSRAVWHTGAVWDMTPGSMSVSSGKWYFEGWVQTLGGINYHRIGICTPNHDVNTHLADTADGYCMVNQPSGTLKSYVNDVEQTLDASFTDITVGTYLRCAFDLDAGKIWFGVNGTWYGDPAAGTGEAYSGIPAGEWLPAVSLYGTTAEWLNFGEDELGYAAPAGFKTLEAKNLPVPTIKDPSALYKTTLYTGTGATQSVTTGHDADIAILKDYDDYLAYELYDTVRGTTKKLNTDVGVAEATDANGLTSFNSDGFTVGASTVVNVNTDAHLAYTLIAEPSSGIDIVTYTGTGVAQDIAHDLGVAPTMIWIKNLGATANWVCYHKELGSLNMIELNLTSAKVSGETYWDWTTPDASNFRVGTNAAVNTNGSNYIAYVFTDTAGAFKTFQYTGNGNADGTFVHLGFRPSLVLVKNHQASGGWGMWDIERAGRFDEIPTNLEIDAASIEVASRQISFLHNGIKLRSTHQDCNIASHGYIGFAFAQSPREFINNGAL